jgi:hypothetical protein
MPKTLRRKIRTAAGLDDSLVPEWCIARLEEAADARIAAGVDPEPEGSPIESD